MESTAIIIPSFNNAEYLYPCVQSLLMNSETEDLFHIYVVNNGSKESIDFGENPYITVLHQERNLGWEGGLKAGLAASTEPYVVFMNDDTFVPFNQRAWLKRMLMFFLNPNCGAVGPTSNVVMGNQQMFLLRNEPYMPTKFLIGFCMLLRRDILAQVGGVDDMLPGGDDLDLSIRLRKAGKDLIIDRETFIYHHGFKTGERVHGGPQNIDGWNSIQKLEKTNQGLIAKHGLRAFLDLWQPMINDPDQEGKMIASMITESERVVDLGCGTRRTVPWAVAMDRLPKGTPVPNVYPPGNSVAEVIGDVTDVLPFPTDSFDVIIARHVIEHVPDIEKTLNNWSNVLRKGGRLIMAVPDDRLGDTLHMDPDHKHALTPDSMIKQLEALGWKTEGIYDPKNKVSFVGVWTK